MFGLMEHMAWSPEHNIVWSVVPTIALPLAAIGFAANALATMIAGWFGLKLKWEGPKRLLEVLLKPRVLLTAVVMNFAIWGCIAAYKYWSNLPASLWRVESINAKLAKNTAVLNRQYGNASERTNVGGPVDSLAHRPPELKQVWHQKLSRGVFGSVTLSGPSAFVGSDDGYVYEFDRTTGRELRKFFVGKEITPDPAIWNQQLIVGEGVHDSHHSRIYFFDLTSGLFQGAFATKGHTEGQPVIGEYSGVTSLFVMAGSDGIYSVDPATREERWHIVPGHVDSEVRISQGLVFFASGIEKGASEKTHFAFAADFMTGKIVWKRELPASGWMAPLLLGSKVCFGAGEIYTESKAGWLTCLDQQSGMHVQSATLDAPLLSIPYLSHSAILVADLDGGVCSLSSETLARNWCVKTPNEKSYASVVSDAHGRLLYPTLNDGLWIIDPKDGSILTKWHPTDGEGKWAKIFGRVTVGADGWFLADMDGNIRKLEVSDK